MTGTAEARQVRGRRRRGTRMLRALGIVLVGAGLVTGAFALAAPERIESAYGAVKTTIDGTVATVRESVFHGLPRVSLGATGGRPELNRCDGTFTRMASYERNGVPPVWAAHNNCHGDVILTWKLGDHVLVSTPDREVEYEVVEVQNVDKTWSSTDDLVGLKGELALQTCFYGKPVMTFIGLEPVGEG